MLFGAMNHEFPNHRIHQPTVGFPTGRPWASVSSARGAPGESCEWRNERTDATGECQGDNSALDFGEHVECA